MVGLLAFVRTVAELPDQPAGNDFPTEEGLRRLLGKTGLTVTDRATLDDFPGAPPAWEAAVTAVEDVIERDHGRDERKLQADEQSGVIGELIGSGLVVGRIVVARTP
jgi:hypothetical protein